MILSRAIFVFTLAASLFSGTAMSQGSTLAEKLQGSSLTITVEVEGCEADTAIFCPGLAANSKKTFMCLSAYEDHLSTSCKVGIVEAALALETGVLAIGYSIEACEADADKYCLDVQPGQGRMLGCLKKNESKLAAQCTTALKETGFWNLVE